MKTSIRSSTGEHYFGVEVTLVSAQAIQGTTSATPEERAQSLARLAERLF